MYRGEIWWANLPDPVASEPGYRRPVLIIQDDTFTQSRLRTVIVVSLNASGSRTQRYHVIITSNIELANALGNVLLSCDSTSLPRDSVANVSQIFTLDKAFLTERIGTLPVSLQQEVDEGLRIVLYL